MQNDEALVVPFFKAVPVEDKAASAEAGRPIFRTVDMVEIRMAGERHYTPTFPAHAVWKRIDGSDVTYAERFPNSYARYAAGRDQVADGTPLSELPFLSEGKRAELRALKVYTAEALASMDGKNLANLGPQGREMKSQAEAYLERAAGSAGSVALAAELEALREQVKELSSASYVSAANAEPDDDAAEKEAIKAQIAEATGTRPRGNPSLATLREMRAELTQDA